MPPDASVVDNARVDENAVDKQNVLLCKKQINMLQKNNNEEDLANYYSSLHRTQIFTKVASVLYLKKPQLSDNFKAETIWNNIPNNYLAKRTIVKIIKNNKNNKQFLREIFLKQGYLYCEHPFIAKSLVRELKLTDLFDEEIIYMHQDGNIKELKREEKNYVDALGDRATLILNTRISAKEKLLETPLHLSLTEIRNNTGAHRIMPITVSKNSASVKLIYPNKMEANAIIALQNQNTIVSCFAKNKDELTSAQADANFFWNWNKSLFKASQAMVIERPGFDEPKDEPEEVQEDGKLRIEWQKAYYRYKSKFYRREEKYKVYDRKGNPTPPQVCIDFIFDAWERSSGNWFKKRGTKPGRSKGFIDFNKIPGMLKRYVPSVLKYAALAHTTLERVDFSKRNHIPYKRNKRFADSVLKASANIKEGDLLIIHGLREEDMKEHFHTLLVLKTDPLTGMPTILADNSGRPRIRSLASAMRSAPRRSLKYRVRINWNWLKRQIISYNEKPLNFNDKSGNFNN